MTPPRFIVPGATYLVTRRCIGRRFLLRPDKEMRNALLYCLAVSAKRYGVSIHALCVMSNHYHTVVTDNEGNLPLFTQYFHRLVALCVQKIRDWDEVVWEPGRKTSMVELLDEGAIIEKTLYTLCNPIKTGLCRKEHQWPGCFVSGTHKFTRPTCLKARVLPDDASLSFEAPPQMTSREWLDALEEHRTDARADAREHARRVRKPGTKRMTVKAALQTKPTFAPRSKRIKGALSPRFACRCQKTMQNAIVRMYAFFDAYRTAVAEMAEGVRTLLPEGCWKLARQLGQR